MRWCVLFKSHESPLYAQALTPAALLCINKSAILAGIKAMLASSLNLSAETFSRELHSLSEMGLIRVERTAIHVYDLEQLHQQCIS